MKGVCRMDQLPNQRSTITFSQWRNAVFVGEQQTQSPLHCWVTAASAEFTCSSKNSLLQVIFPSPPSFAVKGLCSDLQIILLTAVEVGKLRAVVVLNRWCYFKFFLWFLTSVKCSVASPGVSELHLSMCFTPVPTLHELMCVGVCEGWWHCFIFRR